MRYFGSLLISDIVGFFIRNRFMMTVAIVLLFIIGTVAGAVLALPDRLKMLVGICDDPVARHQE